MSLHVAVQSYGIAPDLFGLVSLTLGTLESP